MLPNGKESSVATVEFQNENLIVKGGDEEVFSFHWQARGSSKILAVVPDIITIVDPETGRPILTVRYSVLFISTFFD